MTLKQLEYFLAIARTGQITAAARELNISQPPLSTQLRMLEDELHTELFRREKHNLMITPAGEMLRDRALQILALTGSTVKDVQALGTSISGTINIGAVVSVCYQILPEKSAEFVREHPNVSFQLWEGSTKRIMELLSSGVIDIGIVREPFHLDRYCVHPVFDDILDETQTDPFVVVGLPEFFEGMGEIAEKDEICLRDLEHLPLISHRRFSQLLLAACRKEGFQPNIVCQNDQLVSSYSWATQGLGVAILPLTSAQLQLGEKPMLVKRIRQLSVDARLVMITRKGERLSPSTQAFIALFEEKEKPHRLTKKKPTR